MILSNLRTVATLCTYQKTFDLSNTRNAERERERERKRERERERERERAT